MSNKELLYRGTSIYFNNEIKHNTVFSSHYVEISGVKFYISGKVTGTISQGHDYNSQYVYDLMKNRQVLSELHVLGKEATQLKVMCIINIRSEGKQFISTFEEEFIINETNSFSDKREVKFINCNYERNSRNISLVDLELKCDLHVQCEKCNTCSEDKSEFSHRILSIFSSKIMSDIKIICGDTEFDVHKAVLAVWSPVFLKMLEGLYPEASNGTIVIKDSEKEEFKVFLQFIYSGNSSFVVGHEEKLLYLADKYCVEELKRHCFHRLKQNLSPSQVVKYFLLADKYNGDCRDITVTQYFDSNRVRVMDTDDWIIFKKNCSSVATEILEQSIRRSYKQIRMDSTSEGESSESSESSEDDEPVYLSS